MADWFGAKAHTKECSISMDICGIRSCSIDAKGTMNIFRLIIWCELLDAEFLPYHY